MLLGQKLQQHYHHFMPSLAVTLLADLLEKGSSLAGKLLLMHQTFQGEGEKLPPTKSSLKQHTSKANHQARIWNNAHIPFFDMPPPVGHGWIDENGKMVPLATLQNPAPDAVLELVQCSCAKSRYSANCSCKRNNLVCTGMCKCGADDVRKHSCQ
eukprot:gene4638-20913_t